MSNLNDHETAVKTVKKERRAARRKKRLIFQIAEIKNRVYDQLHGGS